MKAGLVFLSYPSGHLIPVLSNEKKSKKKKPCLVIRQGFDNKVGGNLLSHIWLQYHRRNGA